MLLIELQQDYFFVELLDILSPIFELLALNARRVRGRSQVGESLHLEKLSSGIAIETTLAKVIQMWNLQLRHQITAHIVGRRLRSIAEYVNTTLLLLQDACVS